MTGVNKEVSELYFKESKIVRVEFECTEFTCVQVEPDIVDELCKEASNITACIPATTHLYTCVCVAFKGLRLKM